MSRTRYPPRAAVTIVNVHGDRDRKRIPPETWRWISQSELPRLHCRTKIEGKALIRLRGRIAALYTTIDLGVEPVEGARLVWISPWLDLLQRWCSVGGLEVIFHEHSPDDWKDDRFEMALRKLFG